MQIFLPYKSVIRTAEVLDPRRLNKQILECNWILNSTYGSRIHNHPIYKMYKDHLDFIRNYRDCLVNHRDGFRKACIEYGVKAFKSMPDFVKHADWYIDNFKRRLYAKDPEFYKLFESYGKSNSNYYYINGKWVEY